MAKGKKTGGRNFTKGDPRAGRKKGSKDKIPRSIKASFRVCCEQVGTDDPELIRSALMRGLKAAAPKSFPYLQLWAHYQDGKPTETVKLLDLRDLSEELLQRIDAELADAERRRRGGDKPS